jgi:NAD+ diphosphatase
VFYRRSSAHSTLLGVRTYGEVMTSFTPSHSAPVAASVHRYFHVVGAAVWVSDVRHDDEWPVHFLGMLDDEACWGIDVPAGVDPADGAAVDLRSFYGRAGEVEWLVAGRAVQLVEWARTHRFCGRCGTPTMQQDGERAMRCPACGLLAFPRIAPAMITLVTRGEQALLARGVQFQGAMYSCLAGFVEPGESLEGAVVREVREEVGVEVGNVRYWGSQPWPFPHSLMVGFTAEWQSGEIEIDPTEIVDARWFRRDELPMIPPSISIARKLIDAWLTAEVSP